MSGSRSWGIRVISESSDRSLLDVGMQLGQHRFASASNSHSPQIQVLISSQRSFEYVLIKLISGSHIKQISGSHQTKIVRCRAALTQLKWPLTYYCASGAIIIAHDHDEHTRHVPHEPHLHSCVHVWARAVNLNYIKLFALTGSCGSSIALSCTSSSSGRCAPAQWCLSSGSCWCTTTCWSARRQRWIATR